MAAEDPLIWRIEYKRFFRFFSAAVPVKTGPRMIENDRQAMIFELDF
jgi:hypothetical protein